MSSEDYKVMLDVFEGPLDLLLYLIKKSEVDIHDIPIETITNQYMEYLGVMRMLDLNIAGEFLVMAATLMMIKSRLLLPVEDRPDQEEEEEDDPRWDLIRQLVEYKKFKDAAIFLEDLEERQENVFVREGEGVLLGPEPDVALRDVGIFDLISAFNEALSNAPQETLTEIMADRYTVADMIDFLETRLRTRKQVSLTTVFGEMQSRAEIVTVFLAVLELIKLKQVEARQEGMFGDIVLVDGDETEELGPGSSVEEEVTS